MYGANGYGSETTYDTINSDIDEEYSNLLEKEPGLTPDERLELAIKRTIALDDEAQVKYYVDDYKHWAMRKAFPQESELTTG